MASTIETSDLFNKLTLGRWVPTWKGNLFIFSLLVALVLAAMYWQVRQAQTSYLEHVRLNTGLLAGVIQRNAESAVLSQAVVEQIIGTFLENTARFVDYLDNIQRFSDAELAAFSTEAGLAGIRIQASGHMPVEGPSGWLSDAFSCNGNTPSLRHLAQAHLYCLSFPRTAGSGCIVVGVDAERMEQLQDQIGLPQLLKAVERLSGVTHVRMEKDGNAAGQEITLINEGERQVAEARLALDDSVIVIGMDARPFFARIHRLQREFALMGIFLAVLGVFLSWLLYRFQEAYLKRMQSVERELARQREDATLGRATASIAHEIRNPLNAISMGLQRLTMEADHLSEEHKTLISTMLGAVKRTNGIIGDIRRFAKPLTPYYRQVDLMEIVGRIVVLYQRPCEDRCLDIRINCEKDVVLWADPDLLEQVVENLVKNAVEAQPDGGWIHIGVRRVGKQVEMTVENAGYRGDASDVGRILEPYFTTKTRGTGLGLSNARRIVEAHAGDLAVAATAPHTLRVTLRLPIGAPAEDTVTP